MREDLSPIIGAIEPSKVFDTSSKSQLFVIDDATKGYSCFIADTKGYGSNRSFIIHNSGHKDIHLMRIDGVLFERMSKCDCALLFDNEFDFVELKTNAANKSTESMEYNYSNSYNQLKITIQEFDRRFENSNKSFRDLFDTILAYSVFNPTVPRDNATQKRLSALFSREMRIKLHFTNNKEIK